MSTEAPGSQQLLLGFTLYLSGAVVRTCEDTRYTLNKSKLMLTVNVLSD